MFLSIVAFRLQIRTEINNEKTSLLDKNGLLLTKPNWNNHLSTALNSLLPP